MLTEPLGMPGKKLNQYYFVSIVAILFAVPYSFYFMYNSPEFALILGNLVTLFVESPKRFTLELLENKSIGKNAYEYFFKSNYKIAFEEGQYLEWTFPHEKVDNRGISRFFSITSTKPSGETNQISFATKILDGSSSLKKKLLDIKVGEKVFATKLSGDFVLPNDFTKFNFIFIAGGIGITPFISILRKIKESNQNIKAALFFANSSYEDILYREELESFKTLGLKVVFLLNKEPSSEEKLDLTSYEVGYLNDDILDKYIGKISSGNKYYISGASLMVENYKKLLKGLNIKDKDITTDYFSGL